MKKEKLNDKQRRFAELVVKAGMSQTAAYAEAYGARGRRENVLAACASKLLRKANVQRYVEKLREEARSAAVAGRREKLEWLTRRMREADEAQGEEKATAVANGLRAVAELNKMEGDYAPERVEVKQESTFGAILAMMVEQK